VFSPPPDFPTDDPIAAQVFAAGDRLPVGVDAFPGMEPNDLVLWIESRRAPAEQILETLRPLLELPVEFVLPTHGAPTDRAALERALS
jgi:glyoxylase-like metal-dependent hydrolase (beta-lactamase superfamily II)